LRGKSKGKRELMSSPAAAGVALFLTRNSDMSLCFKRLTTVCSTNGARWLPLSYVLHYIIWYFDVDILEHKGILFLKEAQGIPRDVV